LVPNTLVSLLTTLAAEAHLAGQFLPEKQTLNIEKTDITSRNLQNSFQKRTKFRTKVNMKREQCIKGYLLLHKVYNFKSSEA
jgi:hypothetical protein